MKRLAIYRKSGISGIVNTGMWLFQCTILLVGSPLNAAGMTTASNLWTTPEVIPETIPETIPGPIPSEKQASIPPETAEETTSGTESNLEEEMTRGFETRRSTGFRFGTVMSARQMDYSTDYTVEDALRRLPGVQVDRRGRVNLYGAGAGLHQVMLDGHRVATTGLGDRTVDIYTFSADMVRDIELIRVVRPDMDADALAGVVNLITRRTAADGRELRVVAGGGANTRYVEHMNTDARFAVRFADAPLENFSYALNLSWELDRRGFEALSLEQVPVNFLNGMTDVYERISPAIHMDNRQRMGGLIHLTYNPSEITRFHVRGMLNNGKSDYITHANSWNAGGDWQSPHVTGEVGSQGFYEYAVRLNEPEVRQYNVNIEASHQFDRIDIRYNAGWAYGLTRRYLDELPFGLQGLDFNISLNDPDRPSMLPTNIPLQEDDTIDPRRIEFRHIDRVYDDHLDNTFSAGLDLEIPVGSVSLQIGSHARTTSKTGDHSDSRYTYLRRLTLDQFHMTRHGKYEVFDYYFIPSFVDPYSARSFYRGSRPTFILDERRHYARTEIRNYSVSEQVYAGYGMATMEMGPFILMAGIRLEHTGGKYDGRRVLLDDIGSHVSSRDTSQSKSYTDLFPNVQLGFAPLASTRIHAAYSRTVLRPDYNMLAPYELLHELNESITRGNPDLDPMYSDNLNLFAEQYVSDSGLVTVGLFYKQLSGFFFERNRLLSGGDFDGWREYKIMNGDEKASIYGVEAGIQQHLGFLPGALGNMGIRANYTWSQSDFEIDYRNDAALLGHSPHVVNAALFYEKGRISGQVSWHYTGESLSMLQQTRSRIPAVSNEVYMDHYSDGWTDLSVAFRLRISQQFRFWADANNLLRSERLVYAYDRDRYPMQTEKWGGFGFRAGIRYDL